MWRRLDVRAGPAGADPGTVDRPGSLPRARSGASIVKVDEHSVTTSPRHPGPASTARFVAPSGPVPPDEADPVVVVDEDGPSVAPSSEAAPVRRHPLVRWWQSRLGYRL